MATLLRGVSTLTRQLLSSQCHKCFIVHHHVQSASSVSFFHGLSRWVSPKTSKQIVPIYNCTLSSNYSTSAGAYHGLNTGIREVLSNHTLLKAPPASMLTQTRGMKMKGVLKRRCEHCQIKKRKGNVYVLCKENPRHKQKLIKDKGWYLPGTWVNKWYWFEELNDAFDGW